MTKNLAIVTGAAGWLGSRLVGILAGSDETTEYISPAPRRVRAFDLPGLNSGTPGAPNEDEQPEQSCEIIEGDVTDQQSLAPLFEDAAGATVFHCAGIVHPSRGVKQFYDVNVSGTRNMLRAAMSAGVRRFVHVSSNSPIGCNPSADHSFDESSPYNPYMNYGRSKKQAEDLVNEAGSSGRIETVIIRPPWFYGPNQPPRQTLFFTMIKDGKMPVVGGGENRRSMAYVDNICEGMALAESVEAAHGETYWIADSRAYTMNEIVDTVERLLESEFDMSVAHKRMRLPGIASEVALLIDRTLQGMGIYQQKIHVLSEMNKTIACSTEKAERELGYAPRVDLEEGMRRSIRWVLDRGMKI